MMKKKWIVLGVVLLLACTYVAVMVVQQVKNGTFRFGGDKAFVADFKKGFLEGCKGKDAPAERIKFCECAAEHTVTELTPAQLKDEEFTRKYLTEKVVPVCKNSGVA